MPRDLINLNRDDMRVLHAIIISRGGKSLEDDQVTGLAYVLVFQTVHTNHRSGFIKHYSELTGLA